jgi:hypothetical protein
MERVIIVGNCQARPLEIMLGTNEAFCDRFEFVSFPAVHEMPAAMVPGLHRELASASVAVLQRIHEGYRDGVGLGTETLASIADKATVVRWPSLYWAGYFPELFYMRDGSGQLVVDGPFDLHDRTILGAYREGLDIKGTCHLLADPNRPSEAEGFAANATAELGLRGAGCDVQVTAFIESSFREELLFFTMNHPSNLVLGHVAQQIAELIGLDGRIDVGRLPDELLGSTFYPLHANHVQALGLSFGARFQAGRAPFKIRGVTYEPEAAVKAFFEYYAAHPDLVELNLQPAGLASA